MGDLSAFPGCQKKRKAVELHAFPEGHPNIAKYLHQLGVAHCWCALPYLLIGNSYWSHPSSLRDREGRFLASHIMLAHLLPLTLCIVCANFNPTACFISCIQAGIALGELTSLSDLYDTQSVALLFLIGVVSITPALLSKDEAQEKAPEIAAGASWTPKRGHLATCTYQGTACGGFIGFGPTGLVRWMTHGLRVHMTRQHHGGTLDPKFAHRSASPWEHFHFMVTPTLFVMNESGKHNAHPQAKMLRMCRQVVCVPFVSLRCCLLDGTGS